MHYHADLEWVRTAFRNFSRTVVKSIPTLGDDGNTLDYLHPNTAGLLLYEKQNGGVEKTFWSHRFDNGAVISSGNHLKNEGVDNIAGIRDEISAKSFCVIQTPNETGEKEIADLVWTNTILMPDSDVPKSSDLASFRTINERFLESLPATEMQTLSAQNTLFITTARTNRGDEIITVYSAVEAGKYGHLVGKMHTVTNNVDHNRQLVNALFKNAKKGSRVYVYGVDLRSIDFSEIADSYDVELIRRGPTIVKDFLETDKEIQEISGRRLSPETTSVLNGIPSTKEELQAMSKPSSAPEVWSDFREAVENKLQGRFSERIGTREELFKELTGGANDVVFLFAHFDGKAIYFGEEKVSIDELEALQTTRSGSDRPRVAVLLICNAGVLSTGERFLFRRHLKSVGEVLIKKRFFEKVVAPNHQIESAESISVLSEYLSNSRIKQKGWTTLADLEYLV